jgi:hypothetical protein
MEIWRAQNSMVELESEWAGGAAAAGDDKHRFRVRANRRASTRRLHHCIIVASPLSPGRVKGLALMPGIVPKGSISLTFNPICYFRRTMRYPNIKMSCGLPRDWLRLPSFLPAYLRSRSLHIRLRLVEAILGELLAVLALDGFLDIAPIPRFVAPWLDVDAVVCSRQLWGHSTI